MLLDMTGERVLVTGASSGLGAHFGRTIAKAGGAVALAARRADRIEALAAEIEGAGGHAVAVSLDVADPDSTAAGVAAAEAALGGLTGLVNNAGVAEGGAALECSEEVWRKTMDVNLDGVFRVARRVAEGMVKRGEGGAIVNTASILGIRVSAGVAAYCASKAAVDHLTRALALEWARHRIRVNALAPGYFPTEINRAFLESEAGEKMKNVIPMRRFGAYADLDAPLLTLLSPSGGYITGVTLPVDGGHLVSPL